jgi:hypothetical protein
MSRELMGTKKRTIRNWYQLTASSIERNARLDNSGFPAIDSGKNRETLQLDLIIYK